MILFRAVIKCVDCEAEITHADEDSVQDLATASHWVPLPRDHWRCPVCEAVRMKALYQACHQTKLEPA